MQRLSKFIVLVPVLAFALLIGASTAQAERVKLFHPPHSPLSDTSVVKSAQKHIDRMDADRNPSKNFVSFSSRKNSKLVSKLNSKRQQRNQFRASFLDGKLNQYRNDQLNPIFNRYNSRVDAAKAEYNRDIRRINNDNRSNRKKRAARARLATVLRNQLANLNQQKATALDRANRLIAATRQANFDFFKRISDRDKTEIKTIKVRLRQALVRLRQRLN